MFYILTETAGQDSEKVLGYFAQNGAPCPPDTNPAEHIVEVIQGNGPQKIDWVNVWNQSEERERAIAELEELNRICQANPGEEDTASFATSRWYQFRLVLERLMTQLWRHPDYMWNKIILHVFAALFSGFTFWKMGNGTFDLQLRVFAICMHLRSFLTYLLSWNKLTCIVNFIFVAPGCINQSQPFFLHNRDIFETREKKVG
jgi:hypothetical protein